MLHLKLSQNTGYILCAAQYVLAACFTIFLCKSCLYLSVPTLTFSLLPLSHWQNLPQSKFQFWWSPMYQVFLSWAVLSGSSPNKNVLLSPKPYRASSWHRGKQPTCQHRRRRKLRFDPWAGEIPWRKKRQPTPVFSSVQSLSYVQLCEPMDCSMPGFPVFHYLPELAQTHVHQVGVAIQSSHPLSSPSPAFNFSQHQRLFQWVSSSHQVANVLELQLQYQSFQWIFRADFLQDYCLENPMDRKA